MTTREDLIRQRDAIDAQLAKLDATPWEERTCGRAASDLATWPLRADAVDPPRLWRVHVGNELRTGSPAGPVSAKVLVHVAHVYNAHAQLIACVRALRQVVNHDGVELFDVSPEMLAATKALEELDAL